MQTRNQKYARKIYEQVAAISDPAEAKKYGTMAHKLPVLIRTAGLAQALAFVDSRGTPEQKRLLAHLAELLSLTDADTLLEQSRIAELPEYIRLTRQVQAALVWYKRFAQSVLGVEAGEELEGGVEP